MILQKQYLLLLFICLSFAGKAQKIDNTPTEWLISDLIKAKTGSIEISGNPKTIDSPYGKAIAFNGIDDALFLNEMPLNNLSEFTVEMLFKPDTDSPFEQRILHIGEIKGSRILLEIRAVNSDWYFDAFAVSGLNKKPLADEKLIHPLGKWYHVAFVITKDTLTSFVNGKQELQEAFPFQALQTGQTSIGVRLNKVSWFKGAIYKIKITPKALKSSDFISFIKD